MNHAAVSPGAPGRRRSTLLRTSFLLTLLSAVLPGSGLLGAPRRGLRLLGALTAIASLAVGGYLAFRAVTDLSSLTQVAQRPSTLTLATIVLPVVALIWVVLIVLTQVATRPAGLGPARRAVSALLVTVLAFGIAAPTAVAARYSRDASQLLDAVLPAASAVWASSRQTIAHNNASDPWADTPRVNILLLGADGNAARKERIEEFGVRTDTIMVASIDTGTGAATLIQIPRNLPRTPFPDGSVMAEAFPYGFRGEGDSGNWYINGIWEKTSEGGDYAHLFEGSTFPGAEGLKQGVEGITGLKIDRFVMLNIDGLSGLIDAMGGVTVNVNRDLPIGGNHDRGIRPSGYIEQGPDRHLGGYEAMWFARSRYDSSDYDRMARQSCLVDAIIQQANPSTLVTSFEAIAAASAEILTTDISRDEFGAFIDLAFRVQDGGQVSRLAFVPGKNGYSSSDPDFDAMRAAVEAAVSVPVTPSSTAGAPTVASLSPTATPTFDEQRLEEGKQNVADACAWQG